MNHVVCQAENFKTISRNICSQIYQEANFIVTTTNAIPEFKDLLMEQIFLCGFVGFSEFLNNEWIVQVISWQMESGCFSYNNLKCSSHMNGLGAATLALLGKVLSEAKTF